jgi:tRNA-2-methylthio-N6-dimethylallyladenosine synthase
MHYISCGKNLTIYFLNDIGVGHRIMKKVLVMSDTHGEVIDKTDEIMQNQFLYIEKIKHINAEKTAIDKKQFKYDIRIFGCQMNEHDAEKLAGMLEEMGYVKVSEGEPADIVIFETCCVRENAEEKIYGHLGMLKPSKGDNKGVIAVTGCMMQQPHVVEKIKKSYRHVDIVFGTHNLHAFPELLYKHLKAGYQFPYVRNS